MLITGESGTGKEIVARYVHAASPRRSCPFVAVNCSSLPEALVESELFGHERGAFTGATEAKAGWFECAQGGTLLLDEVGDLPLSVQVKLLRILQEAEVVRVGSRRPVGIDVRVIAATNVELEEAVARGRFREDLYYRLHVAPLALLPLRDRPGDILPLTHRFIQLHQAGNETSAVTLTEDAERRLLEHRWPGNVRELENVIRYALLVRRDHLITAADLRLSRSLTPRPRAASESAPNLLERVLPGIFEQNLPRLHQTIEHTVFSAAYRYCHRNQLETARLLGVSRNIVRARLLESGELAGNQDIRSTPSAKESSHGYRAAGSRTGIGPWTEQRELAR